MLIDFYNDPNKKSYGDYLEALEENQGLEAEVAARNEVAYPHAKQDIAPIDRVEAEMKKAEAMRAELAAGSPILAEITAELDWRK